MFVSDPYRYIGFGWAAAGIVLPIADTDPMAKLQQQKQGGGVLR